jgi:hypothetical protein
MINTELKKKYLPAHAILRFLMTDDEELNNIIIYEPSKYDLISTDQEIYEALSSIKDYNNMNMAKLKKFFEIVEINSHKKLMGEERTIIIEEKVESIRKKALGDKND